MGREQNKDASDFCSRPISHATKIPSTRALKPTVMLALQAKLLLSCFSQTGTAREHGEWYTENGGSPSDGLTCSSDDDGAVREGSEVASNFVQEGNGLISDTAVEGSPSTKIGFGGRSFTDAANEEEDAVCADASSDTIGASYAESGVTDDGGYGDCDVFDDTGGALALSRFSFAEKHD